MRWFFPNFPLNRLDYLKRLLVLLGLYFALTLVTKGMEAGSGAPVGIAFVVGILAIVLVFSNFNVLWWRIHSCFETRTAVWIWFILSFVPFVGILWLVWPPRAELRSEPEKSVSKILTVIGVIIVLLLVTGLIAAIALPAYQVYIDRANTKKASSIVMTSADRVASAVETYAIENLTWPNNETDLAMGHIPQGITVRVRDNRVFIRSAKGDAQFSMTASFDAGEVSWQCDTSRVDSETIPSVCL